MNDRELLEMAAKAVGITGMYDEKLNAFVQNDNEYFPTVWRPHLDDGDALRLAVRLNLLTERNMDSTLMEVWLDATDDDKNRATRRAIVRAAAEIGSQMT